MEKMKPGRSKVSWPTWSDMDHISLCNSNHLSLEKSKVDTRCWFMFFPEGQCLCGSKCFSINLQKPNLLYKPFCRTAAVPPPTSSRRLQINMRCWIFLIVILNLFSSHLSTIFFIFLFLWYNKTSVPDFSCKTIKMCHQNMTHITQYHHSATEEPRGIFSRFI